MATERFDAAAKAISDGLDRRDAKIAELTSALEAIRGVLAGYAGQPNHMGDVFKIADAALSESVVA
jgi:hypothetical protein